MRAIVIANSGTALANVTRLLAETEGIEIVRHATGQAHVDALVGAFAPDLVVIDDMRWPPLALARIAEVRAAAPDAAVLVLAERLEGTWLVEALRLGVAAVMPAGADAETFRRILGEATTRTRVAA